MKCQACEKGDHANCNLSTACDCECDPTMAEPIINSDYEDYPDDYEDDEDIKERKEQKLAEIAGNCNCGAWQFTKRGIIQVAEKSQR